MSGRGRGRGGRGRGRGGGVQHPVARDDTGAQVQVVVEGPPPLYPENKRLPPPIEVDPELERLIARRRRLREFYRASPYFLSSKEAGKAGEGAAADYAERYKDREKKRARVERDPLHLLIQPDPRYFPPELFGARTQGAAAIAQAQQEYWDKQKAAAGAPDEDERKQAERAKLDELIKGWESKAGGVAPAGASPAAARRAPGVGVGGVGGEEEGGAPLEGEEEDVGELEDNPEEDDYYQARFGTQTLRLRGGNYFDDDEGYDDGYDDGDGGDAVY
eukprot:scaffold5.g916.t1